jgi:hypothetical protein
VAETATYTTEPTEDPNIIPAVRFEPAIPKIKRLHTYALDSTVAGIGVREALHTENMIKYKMDFRNIYSKTCLI